MVNTIQNSDLMLLLEFIKISERQYNANKLFDELSALNSELMAKCVETATGIIGGNKSIVSDLEIKSIAVYTFISKYVTRAEFVEEQ